MKWTKAEQGIFDCITTGLRALTILNWLSAEDYQDILNIIQKNIEIITKKGELK